MNSQKPVLPNFLKTALLALSISAFSFNAYANEYEEETDAAMESASQMNDVVESEMNDLSTDESEAIGDLKDMSEEASEEAEADEETAHDMVGQ